MKHQLGELENRVQKCLPVLVDVLTGRRGDAAQGTGGFATISYQAADICCNCSISWNGHMDHQKRMSGARKIRARSETRPGKASEPYPRNPGLHRPLELQNYPTR